MAQQIPMRDSKAQQGFGNGGPNGALAQGGEKAENFGRAIKKLFSYCKTYLPAIAAAVFLAVAGSVLNIVGPGKLAEITNLITNGMTAGIDLEAVAGIAWTLIAFYFLGFLCSLIQGIIMATVTQQVSKTMRFSLFQKINHLPLKYFDSNTIGDTLSRLTNDVDTIGQTLNQSMGTLVSSGAMLLGSMVMMFYTNWVMALSGMAATILGFGFMMVIISRSQKYFVKQQRELGALNGHIEETYGGHTVVKAYSGEDAAQTAFSQMNQQLYRSAWKSQYMSGMMQPLMGFVGNLGYVVICIVGAVLAVQGSISFGTIVAFILYIRLFTQPLTQLAQAATNLQSAAAASERVFAMLEEPEASVDRPMAQLQKAKGEVEFRNIRFGYEEGQPVIHNLSFCVKPGQKIAIVGPTGAGKTTLVNLLMRFYEPESGDIWLDGVPIQSLSRKNVREQFCMVLQDTWLFEGTIRENIVYSSPNATEEQVVTACKAVGLHHFIKTLPNGYDTVLGDNASLSVGQRQLMTIARAMVENAPMLILDEATSSVDTRTEVLIQQAMDRLMAGRTSFIIAHRLSTIRNADLILVMEDGDIIESGTHEQLMAKNGLYFNLYNSQFAKTSAK